jgi:hypothetical protein
MRGGKEGRGGRREASFLTIFYLVNSASLIVDLSPPAFPLLLLRNST